MEMLKLGVATMGLLAIVSMPLWALLIGEWLLGRRR